MPYTAGPGPATNRWLPARLGHETRFVSDDHIEIRPIDRMMFIRSLADITMVLPGRCGDWLSLDPPIGQSW